MKHVRNWIVFAVLLIMCIEAHAANLTPTSFTIGAIRVDGLHRIDKNTVLNYLPCKVGDVMNDATADNIIHTLYKTGFFTNVMVGHQGSMLIVTVNERPVIATLTVTGDKAFDHDVLMKSLSSNGLKAGNAFDKGVLDSAVGSLKSEYYNMGLYSVTISDAVTQLQRNRVSISITINEGNSAKIVSIRFVGNHKFSAKVLSHHMFLTSGNMLSWWFKDNRYSSDKLEHDLSSLRDFYLDNGYINAKISGSQTQLSADKKSIYITIKIIEGDLYHTNKREKIISRS